MILSRKLEGSSFSMKQALVYEVTVSRRTSTNCLPRLMISAAKESPIVGGESLVEAGDLM